MGGWLNLVARPARGRERAGQRMTCRISSIMFWLGCVAWISSLVTAAIAAMHVFGTLPQLGIIMEPFTSLPSNEQGRIAGGMVMIKVFTTVDRIQAIGA